MTVRPESSSSTRTSSGCSTSQETMYSRVSRDPIAAPSLRLDGLGFGLLARDDTLDLEESGYSLGRLRSLADPLESPLAVDLDGGGVGAGVVTADVLDEPPVPWG